MILHYTALDHDKSVRVLTTQAVSSHYLVNDSTDIEIYQLVDENKRSYHAGISSWRKDATLNDTSIGIEIVNEGFKVVDGKRVFVPFPEHQVKKVAALVQDIVMRYQIPPTNVLAHSDIAPTRKNDPNWRFPWQTLSEKGFGLWWGDTTNVQVPAGFDPLTAIRIIGYDVKDTTAAILGFKRHFMMDTTKGMTPEAAKVLFQLHKKYL